MSLLLATYNDSMRLGMGFNSYTQTMCVDNAVKVTGREVVRTEDPSQIVTYSSKIVENLSEVVGAMNISYSTSIRKGTVELAGSSNSIQEDKIKQSDLNIVVSVKVVNQTTIINENSEFLDLVGVVPGTKDFDDAFGDCYISGFIEGGDFNAIISIRVMDRSSVSSVASAIKKSLSSGSGNDFTLDMDAFSTGMAGSSALKDTETTISVSWMGGGQIKDPRVQWDVDSIFAAAAAFPSQVAKCPQRTWAILTKYRANRSFQQKLSRTTFSPLEYDAVASYTVELFENYMEYKQLMKLIQDMTVNTANYLPQKDKHNAIALDIKTLVAVKTAFRNEMNKIVQAVGVLAADPNSLKRNTSLETPSNDATVRQILKEALGGETWQEHDHSKSTSNLTKSLSSADDRAAPEASLTASEVSSDGKAQINTPASTSVTVDTDGSNEQPADNRSRTPNDTFTDPSAVRNSANAIGKAIPRREIDFDFSKLIAPEVWSDLLPLPNTTDKLLGGATASKRPDSVNAQWARAPVDDSVVILQKDPSIVTVKLTILVAVCGLTDITDQLSNLVTGDQQLHFTGQQLQDYTAKHAIYKLQTAIPFQFGILYQYTNQPIRLRIMKDIVAAGLESSYQIDVDSKDLVVKPSPWNTDTWSITAVTYAGRCYNDNVKIMDLVNGELRTLGNRVPRRSIFFTNGKFDVASSPPNYLNVGMIFYQVREGGRMRVAMGIESRISAVMTDDLIASSVMGPTQFGGIARSGRLNSQSSDRPDGKPRNPDRYIKVLMGDAGTTPYPSPPRLLYGLRHIEVKTPLDGFTFGFDVIPPTVNGKGFQSKPWATQETNMTNVGMSWLALPPYRESGRSDTIQTGYIETDFMSRKSETQTSLRLLCHFHEEFSSLPKVVCWLMSVDFKKQPNSMYGIEVEIEDIYCDQFTILVKTPEPVGGFENVKVGWLAYVDEDEERETVKVAMFDLGSKNEMSTEIEFGGKVFTQTPAIFTAITGFRLDAKYEQEKQLNITLRAYQESPKGYKLGLWATTERKNQVKAVVIAIEP